MSPSTRLAVVSAAIACTAAPSALALRQGWDLANAAIAADDLPRVTEVAVLYGILALLMYSTLIYQLASFGFWLRQMRRPNTGAVSKSGSDSGSSLLVLVPSYKEEEGVIWQTLISAAMIEHPDRRVVLLIDDPPFTGGPVEADKLAIARRLPARLQTRMAPMAAYLQAQIDRYQTSAHATAIDLHQQASHVADLYNEIAGWLEQWASEFSFAGSSRAHADRFWATKILLDPASQYRARARELQQEPVTGERIASEYRRLSKLFAVSITSFERKRFVNLSHAPNKAMNLNSYIQLLGQSFVEHNTADGIYLTVCASRAGTTNIRSADYIAIIDADSFVTSDFASRLIGILEQPGNERVAVAQTPYTAISGIPGGLERTAAASTDAQFFNHQGLAHFNISSWVGASALVRKVALDDIATETVERGYPLKVFICDRVLIEDAAATIDLLAKGWRVHHENARLSYSATPPDFGSLLIQRRRWANGGLLIVPRLMRLTFSRPWSLGKIGSALIRLPHLMAATISGFGLPILLFYRFDDALVPIWIPLIALPYWALQASDIMLAGYRWTELPRIYALNILLIVANFSGTWHSLRQALTGRLMPFKRTPKRIGRVAVPAPYLTGLYGLCLYAFFCCASDAWFGNYRHMAFTLFNGSAAAYALARFVGWQESREDFAAALAGTPQSQWVRALARMRVLGRLPDILGQAESILPEMPADAHVQSVNTGLGVHG